MSAQIASRISSLFLSTLFACPVLIGVAGCTGDSLSGYPNHYGAHDNYDNARSASERRGDRNTERSDIRDDGRLNGSARSYDERKASREADEGNYDAARREAELRRERLNH